MYHDESHIFKCPCSVKYILRKNSWTFIIKKKPDFNSMMFEALTTVYGVTTKNSLLLPDNDKRGCIIKIKVVFK